MAVCPAAHVPVVESRAGALASHELHSRSGRDARAPVGVSGRRGPRGGRVQRRHAELVVALRGARARAGHRGRHRRQRVGGVTETQQVAQLMDEHRAKIDGAGSLEPVHRVHVVAPVHVDVGVGDAARSVHHEHRLGERSRHELARPLLCVEADGRGAVARGHARAVDADHSEADRRARQLRPRPRRDLALRQGDLPREGAERQRQRDRVREGGEQTGRRAAREGSLRRGRAARRRAVRRGRRRDEHDRGRQIEGRQRWNTTGCGR